jgi:hypothetical protein
MSNFPADDREQEYGPTWRRRPEHDPTESGTVNDGPEQRLDEPTEPRKSSGPWADRADALRADASADLEELTGGELALRGLLHGAVEPLEPSPDALDRLRRAVPARRARKRQALVGMAAAALLGGTAVPALVHVANSGGAKDNPAIAGHGEASGDSGNGEKESGTGQADNAGSGDQAPSKGNKEDNQQDDDAQETGSGSGGIGGTGSSAGTADSALVACGAAQLGNTSTISTGTPDAEGKIYGTFRLVNISSAPCMVAGPGTVTFAALGAADQSRISVVQHTSGDPATGLPDPSAEQPSLVLQPNQAYDVKFAWVPSDNCPSSGGTSSGPSPSDGGAASGGEESSGSGGTQAQFGSEEPGGDTGSGSVSVSYTAEGGAHTGMTISNGCAGTIYRTGVLAAS